MDLVKPRMVMIYGESGSSKTSQLYFVAKWLLEKYAGRIIRMIHGDPGGYAPFEDSGLISNKSVTVFDFLKRKRAIADFNRLSEGYWPRMAKRGDTIEEYFQTVDACKTTDYSKICAYFLESLTSLGDTLLGHCSNQESGVGFKESWKYTEEDYTVLGLQEGHYGIVQKELRARLVDGFASIPVPYIFVTALVGKGEDKITKEMVYGPQMVGNKTTPKIPSWFGGGCFHLDTIRTEKDGKLIEQKVAWFIDHFDANTGIKYLAKARCMPENMPKLMQQFPGGYVPLGFNAGLDKYFRFMDTLTNNEG